MVGNLMIRSQFCSEPMPLGSDFTSASQFFHTLGKTGSKEGLFWGISLPPPGRLEGARVGIISPAPDGLGSNKTLVIKALVNSFSVDKPCYEEQITLGIFQTGYFVVSFPC